MPISKILVKKFTSLFFPSLCLHCEDPLLGENRFFCQACAFQLSLITPTSRCPRCFSEKKEGFCCPPHKIRLKIAAALDYRGPAQSLIKQLKYGKMFYLASLCSDFCLAQWHQLQWPLPDMIVPVPMSYLRLFFRGFNQSKLIAKEIADKLGLPLKEVLVRKMGGLPQSSLNAEKRKKLNRSSFSLRNDDEITNKIVLLIDDVLTTGTTLRACAEMLSLAHPKAIYGLTVVVADL